MDARFMVKQLYQRLMRYNENSSSQKQPPRPAWEDRCSEKFKDYPLVLWG